MLVTMVEDIATVIDNSSEKNKIDERLANTINKSKIYRFIFISTGHLVTTATTAQIK